jgi:hypothetical protein
MLTTYSSYLVNLDLVSNLHFGKNFSLLELIHSFNAIVRKAIDVFLYQI